MKAATAGAVAAFLGLLLVYQNWVGGYARVWEYISVVFMRVRWVLEGLGGLTGPARTAGVGFVAGWRRARTGDSKFVRCAQNDNSKRPSGS